MDARDTRAAISEFLFIHDNPEPVDLVLVAASPSISSVLPAIELYQAGLARKILISGNGTMADGRPEWVGYREFALAQGLAEADLYFERKATNTLENIIYSRGLIEHFAPGFGGIETIALCAKPFHMRRVMMTAQRHLPGHIRLIARPPSDPGDVARDNWWKTEIGRNRILKELGRISEYALRGDIGGF